jgi:hypothetical protein
MTTQNDSVSKPNKRESMQPVPTTAHWIRKLGSGSLRNGFKLALSAGERDRK